MDEIVAVVVIAAAAFALFVFAALQVAHRFSDHRIDARLRVAILAELDEAPPETVAGPAVALAFVSQLPVASLLLHGSISIPSVCVLVAEVALAAAAGIHLADGRALGRRIALRYSRSPRWARGG
jgi:hypothetical protein